MNEPFFSIIIPTYNRADLLRSTIDSILKQSFENWELLIIDDGSTDNTQQVIQSIEDERIRYYFQENNERSAARNLGIAQAFGSYICFLDSDDSFQQDHLEGFYSAIQNTNSAAPSFYFCGVTIHFEKGDQRQVRYNFDATSSVRFFAEGSVIPGQVCISKEILVKQKFDEKIVVAEDTDLWIRIAYHFTSVYIDQTTINYNMHEGNSINVKNNAYLKRLKGLKRTFSKPEGMTLPNSIRKKILSDCYFGIFKFHVNRNELLKARLTMLKSLFLYPTIRVKEKIYLFIHPKNLPANE